MTPLIHYDPHLAPCLKDFYLQEMIKIFLESKASTKILSLQKNKETMPKFEHFPMRKIIQTGVDRMSQGKHFTYI